MLKAKIQQLHVPELCKCQYHQNKVFLCKTIEHTFIDYAKLIRTLIEWNRSQGNDACWVYSVLSVEAC